MRFLLASLCAVAVCGGSANAQTMTAPDCAPLSAYSGNVRLTGTLAREGRALVLTLAEPICLRDGGQAVRVRVAPVGQTLRARLNAFAGRPVEVRGEALAPAQEADPPLRMRAFGVARAR